MGNEKRETASNFPSNTAVTEEREERNISLTLHFEKTRESNRILHGLATDNDEQQSTTTPNSTIKTKVPH